MKIAGTVEFSVPILPPSVNHYKQPRRGGGWYRAAEAIAFDQWVSVKTRPNDLVCPGAFYDVELTFHLGPEHWNLSSNDADNFLKVALDALGPKRAGVIRNDSRILCLIVNKVFVSDRTDESTHYRITGKDDDENKVFPQRPTPSAPRVRTAEGSKT